MTRRIRLAVAVAAALFLGVAACADDGPATSGGAAVPGGGAGAAAGEITYKPGDLIEFRASEFAFVEDDGHRDSGVLDSWLAVAHRGID